MEMLEGDMLDGRAEETIESALELWDEDHYNDEMTIPTLEEIEDSARYNFKDSIYHDDIDKIVDCAMLRLQLRRVHDDDFNMKDATKEVLGYIEDSDDFKEQKLLQHCRNYLDWHEFSRLYTNSLYNVVVGSLVESCQEMSRG